MNHLRLGLAMLVLGTLAAAAPTARAAVAVLEQMTGQPTIHEVGEAGARHVSLPRRGARYTLPIEIETGPADSATFRLPDGDVSVAPSTIMRVAAPVRRRDGVLQRIFQEAGSSLFAVDRHETEHFEVETPFLVSVVKGTLFSVVVHDDGATVALHDGRLQVNSPDGGRSVELRPGDVAFSGRDGDLQKLDSSMARREPAGAGDGPGERRGSTPPADSGVGPAVADRERVPSTVSGRDASTVDIAAAVAAELPSGVDDLALEIEDSMTHLTADLDDTGGALVGDLGDTTGDLMGDIGNAGGDLLGDSGEITSDLVDEVADATGDLVGDIGDTAGDLVGDIGDTAGDLLGDSGDTAGDLVDEAGDTTGDLVGDVGGILGRLRL